MNTTPLQRNVTPLLAFFLTLVLASNLSAQQDELSDDIKKAIGEITQKRVTSAISFLASDELGGRDTPSPGLRIASAYVASRFRGAGLEAVGENDSFFQYAEIATEKCPSNITFTSDGKSVDNFGLLSGSKEDISIEGEVQAYKDGEEIGDIVSLEVNDFGGDRRAEFMFSPKPWPNRSQSKNRTFKGFKRPFLYREGKTKAKSFDDKFARRSNGNYLAGSTKNRIWKSQNHCS